MAMERAEERDSVSPLAGQAAEASSRVMWTRILASSVERHLHDQGYTRARIAPAAFGANWRELARPRPSPFLPKTFLQSRPDRRAASEALTGCFSQALEIVSRVAGENLSRKFEKR